MFKLEPNPTFWAPVEIHVPGQGKGSFEVEYRYLDQDAARAFGMRLAEKDPFDAVAEIVVGWREMDVPFSRDNLRLLLKKYAASAPLLRSFSREIFGAAEKN